MAEVTGIIHTTEEFYNKNHDPKTGRFTTGKSSGIRASEVEPKKGRRSEEDEVENELNKTFGKNTVKRIRDEGHDPKDYNFRDKDGNLTGKPLPGSDSWKKAHGIDKKVYDTRPTKRFSGPNDPVIDEIYKDVSDPSQKRFTKAKVASQSPGFIMERKPLPGADEAGFGPIPPQARPDNKVVIDQRSRARKTRELAAANRRKEFLETATGADIVAEREARVNRLKKDLRAAKALDKQDLTGPAKKKLDAADKQLKKAEASGDDDAIAMAKRNRKIAESEFKAASKKGNLIESGDRTRAARIIQQELDGAEASLARAKADPEKALKNARAANESQIAKKQAALDKTAVKYAFPPGEGSASRMEAHQDPQNIKNLTEGNGRVYFVMEGQIKADAVLSQVKKEDPKAAVVSVPSVTAWNEKEVAWATDKYFKGRDVVLIPDADGVTNDAVVKQAKTLQGRMLNGGAGTVTVASPPLIKNKRGQLEVEDIWYPTGVKDGRKGVDDHIGLGKGTLGDLTFNDTPRPKFDLSKETGTKKLRSNSVKNAETTLEALSDLAGENGTGRISKKAISKTTGLPESSVHDALKTLEKKGYIKRYDIFDPKALENGRREPTMEFDEIKRITKKAGVSIPDLDTKYVFNDDIHEAAPIYEILDNKYITKPGPSKSLADNFKGLQKSDRVVRTPEGAAKYGVPIGSPIPGALTATGIITLAMVTENVKAAGLAVVAKDTGRVLMLQRALSEDDNNAGKWEFPGGKIDDGEEPYQAARREFQEETGMTIPDGTMVEDYICPNGKYELFVFAIENESDLDINLDHEDRRVLNPDDPDGDNIEVVAWWNVDDMKDNPAIREEVKEMDWSVLKFPRSMVATGYCEFHNQCHNKTDGRFCKAPGGAGKRAAAEKEQKDFIKNQDKTAGIRRSSSDKISPETKTKFRSDLKKQSKGELVSELAWKGLVKASKNKYVREKALALAVSVAVPIGLRFAGKQIVKKVSVKYLVKQEESVLANAVFKTVIAKDGSVIKLVDTTGKMTDKEVDSYLSALKVAYDRNPVKGGPPSMIIHDQHSLVETAHAFVVGRKNTNVIHINKYVMDKGINEQNRLNDLAGMDYDDGWFGSSYASSPIKHVVSHEYGHVLDYNSRTVKSSLKSKVLYAKAKSDASDLSLYGKTSKEEAYAEAFADWTTSSGKTSNDTTKNYANSYGWK